MAERITAVNMLLIFVLLASSTYGSIIHVPTKNGIDCSNKTICLPITDLFQSPSRYFKSNTTIFFQAGTHSINTDYGNILISQVANLTISGAVQNDRSTPTIFCHQPLGLTFVQVQNLTIKNIRFENCGSNVSREIREAVSNFVLLCYEDIEIQLPPCSLKANIDNTVIAVFHSIWVEFANLNIENTNGIALVAINIYWKLKLNGVTLRKNMVNCLIATAIPAYYIGHLPPENYDIQHSTFDKGNLTDDETLLSSGLNILLRDLQNRLVAVLINNTICKNNIGRQGNVLIQVSVHDEATTYFNITHLEVMSCTNIQSESLPKGVLIVAISGLVLGTKVSKTYLNFEKIQLNNVALVILVNKFDRATTYIEAHFKKVEISHNKGGNSLLVNHANVTLTDLHLINTSRMLLLDSNININGHSTLENSEGVLTIINSTMHFNGETTIQKNRATYDSIIRLIKSAVFFDGTTRIEENVSIQESCISATYKSTITVNGKVVFYRNKGHNGGAIALYHGSYILIEHSSPYTSLSMIENKAESYGGAIFIEDYYTEERSEFNYAFIIPCWLRTKPGYNITNSGLYLINNTAQLAGNGIFGGWQDFCYKKLGYSSLSSLYQYGNDFNHSFYSSTPVRVCMCQNGGPKCNFYPDIQKLSPGKTFTMDVVAVGQRFGTVPSVARATLSSGIHINKLQQYQTTGKECTKLNYTVRFDAINLTESLELKVERFSFINNLNNQDLNNLLFVNLFVLLVASPCSKGYTFNNSTKVCKCHHVLQEQGIECDIQTGTVKRSREWINTTLFHTIVYNPSEPAVIVHQHCPLNYCKKESMYLNLEQPDDQCHYNRSGTLCGKCKNNTSAVFGSSNCTLCTNNWVFLIVPLVIVSGVILVVFLTILNVTVSSGTINGLIFYANIVRANQSTFFPSNSFLSWFIAWLNLDIGFEVCFYDGLDTYTKTWLQFVFPLYVWLLVILMIISSHYSTRASRVFGNNAVQVLATLFLLSYTKLLRITIVSLSYTELAYPNGYIQKVWLYDGNVDYLQGKHIALFIAALAVLIFLSIPYTFLLVTIQWLQRYTHYSALKWVTRFQPTFDAYTGPYKNKHRYWPGLLLLIRVVLFLTFSLNIIGDPTINLLAIITAILCLLTYSAYLGGVYKSWSLDVLENSFHLNLAILSSATLYISASGGDQSKLVLTSTGIAFSTFILIIAYHIYLRLSKTARYSKLKKWVLSKVKAGREQHDDTDGIEIPTRSISLPTQTVVELHEPLLD